MDTASVVRTLRGYSFNPLLIRGHAFQCLSSMNGSDHGLSTFIFMRCWPTSSVDGLFMSVAGKNAISDGCFCLHGNFRQSVCHRVTHMVKVRRSPLDNTAQGNDRVIRSGGFLDDGGDLECTNDRNDGDLCPGFLSRF